LATLDIYAREKLFARAAELAPFWQDAVHSLKGRRHVIDIRNIGLVGAVEVDPRSGAPGARASDVFLACFKAGVLVRVTGDVIALSPPLIIEKPQIQRIVDVLGDALDQVV
jgi:beta-alanine--pyruvate transaminase